MPRLQIMHQPDPAHVFLKKEVILEKLPPLRREGFSYSSPSSLSLQEDKVRKRASMKNCQQEILPSENWPEPVQRRHNSATAKQEEKHNVFMERSEMDGIFPLKPVCHRRAFNPNNCQADSDDVIKKDKTSLGCLEAHWRNDKQASNRRQEKNDLRELERFDTESQERGETDGKSPNGYQPLHEDQRRLYEHQIWLKTEIRKKEIVLQQKLLKAEEGLRKVQLKVKKEERRKNVREAENGLYFTDKGNWDWESARDRALRGRRDEGQRERIRDWARGNKDGIERRENHVKETNAGQKEKKREGIEWENRGRSTLRTTNCKPVEKEWDHFEEMTRQKWERAAYENDKTRRERPMEWRRNEMREWDRRDWQEKERVNVGEKQRGKQAKVKRDMEIDDEVEQWDLMNKLTLNSHVKGKASSKHDKNRLIDNHWATQERLHQYSNRAAEETTESIKMGLPKEPLTEAAPSTHQKGKRLQQVEFSPERSPDSDLQLVPCKICHRRFAKDRLNRHIRVCEKMQHSKRKIFDSSQYRAKGTELEEFMKTNGRCKTPEPKKNNWRQKHEALIRNMRQARDPAPGGFQPQPSADLNPDYLTCPHCGRRFAPGPAERHIPKCLNIKSRPPPLRYRH